MLAVLDGHIRPRTPYSPAGDFVKDTMIQTDCKLTDGISGWLKRKGLLREKV